MINCQKAAYSKGASSFDSFLWIRVFYNRELVVVRTYHEPTKHNIHDGLGDLQSHCDGCGQKFSVRHVLSCMKDGLMIPRHNEIQDELSNLASEALFPSAVCNEPRIHISRPVEKKTDLETPSHPVSRNLRKSLSEERGDVLIRGLWARGTDCIIDVHVTDTDAKSNLSRDPAKVLEAQEREKKRKHLKDIGREVKTLMKKLSAMLAENWEKPYAEVCGYVAARMSIFIVRATHRCL